MQQHGCLVKASVLAILVQLMAAIWLLLWRLTWVREKHAAKALAE
jgi:hypothetical protein